MKRVITYAFLLLITFTIPGCELVGDLLQIGFVGGVIVVLLLVALIGWILRKIF